MSNVIPLFRDPVIPQEPSVQKLEAFRKGLEGGGIVMISLDSSVEGVSLPSRLMGLEWVNLNFSRRYNLPDFGYDEVGVSATLSFDEGYFYCMVPWSSVFRVGDRVWQEDAL